MAFKPTSLGMNRIYRAISTEQHHLTVSDGDRHVSDGDGPCGRIERHDLQARGAVRVDEREVDDGRGLVSRQAEPITDPFGVARDPQAADGDVGVGPDRRVHALVFPLDVVGQLRVGNKSLDSELTPLELDAIGAVPAADHGLTAESLLGLGEVVDADNPSQPATASLGTGSNGLAERRLVGGGVVKYRDDLDITLVGQGKDDVAGTEA